MGKTLPDLQHLWDGDSDLAREALAKKDDPYSVFRRACLELHEGEFIAARDWLARCDLSDPASVFLGQLIEQRESAGDPWLTSFDNAWHASNRIDLRPSKWLGRDAFASYRDGFEPSSLSDANRALGAFMVQEIKAPMVHPGWLRSWAKSGASEDRDIPELVVALEILSSEQGFSGRLPPEGIAQLGRLAILAESNVTVELNAFLAGRVQTGFTLKEIDDLEQIAVSAKVDASHDDQIFLRMCDLAKSGDASSPVWSAIQGAMCSLTLPMILSIFGAVDATSNELRNQAAEQVLRIGRRLLEDRFLITYGLGTGLIEFANRTLKRPAQEAEARANREEFESMMRTTPRADPRMWPLPDLLLEARVKQWKSELAFLRQLDNAHLSSSWIAPEL